MKIIIKDYVDQFFYYKKQRTKLACQSISKLKERKKINSEESFNFFSLFISILNCNS